MIRKNEIYVECCLMPLNFLFWHLLVLVYDTRRFLQYVIQCGDCISIHTIHSVIFKDENKKQNKLVLQAKKIEVLFFV